MQVAMVTAAALIPGIRWIFLVWGELRGAPTASTRLPNLALILVILHTRRIRFSELAPLCSAEVGAH